MFKAVAGDGACSNCSVGGNTINNGSVTCACDIGYRGTYPSCERMLIFFVALVFNLEYFKLPCFADTAVFNVILLSVITSFVCIVKFCTREYRVNFLYHGYYRFCLCR